MRQRFSAYVENGDVKWKTIVQNFYPDLDEAVNNAEKELEKIPREKTREIARQNIADIRSSNRRDFRF